MYAFLDTGNLDSRHLPFAPVVLRRQSIEFGKQPLFPGGSLRRGLPESQQRIVPEPKTFLRRIAFSSETIRAANISGETEARALAGHSTLNAI